MRSVLPGPVLASCIIRDVPQRLTGLAVMQIQRTEFHAMITGAHNRAALISLALAAAAAIAVTALPLCAQVTLTESASMMGGAVGAATEFRRVPCGLTAYQVLIAWLPVVIGAVVVALRTTAAAGIARFIAAAMLLGFVIVAGFSIGLLYAPAAAAMIVAARIGHAQRRATPALAME